MNGDDTATGRQARLALFAVMWGAAALFHIAGNPRPSFLPSEPLFVVAQTLLGLAAGWVLLRRGRGASLLVLSGLVIVNAWLEAPLVGNHFVLAAAVSGCYLLAGAVARRPRWRDGADASPLWDLFAPAARLTLLAAYGFAAFAKLNSSFFDPTVSCAVHYHNELVGSWGLGVLGTQGSHAMGLTLAGATAAIELSIPILLAMRRTRRVGLLIALSFHWLLALDLAQHFWDFSAVLFAAFLLFADGEQLEDLHRRGAAARDGVRPAVRRAVTGLIAVLCGVVILAAAVPRPPVQGAAVLAAHVAWIGLATPLLVGMWMATISTRRRAAGVSLRPRAAVVLVIPVLALANGLTPYLELKTGFGWNMYGNLRTVAGETNHLIVPATLDLTGLQDEDDRVEILATSDPDLAPMIGSGYVVPYSEFLEYAHTYPDAAVTYRRNGQVHEAPRIGDDPAGRGEVSIWSQRLQSFRVIDTRPAERCQAVFSPAR